MAGNIVLTDWITGGARPRRLAPELVIGSIRWKKVLGAPAGKLEKAFRIQCYHVNRVDINNDQSKYIRSDHSVDAWEGPHTASHFQVTFMTDSQHPDGYDVGSTDRFRNINLLEVSFRPGVSWKNNLFTGRGGKVIVPASLTFAPPIRAQRLPEIEVIHLMHSLRP